ncbi:MAG: hypothetical protein D6729_16670 [Deltaproteobacteria bacterium]|nr:MAG: hypothetical protein D6729_16670 [Deltaproteobacteria bacterium]
MLDHEAVRRLIRTVLLDALDGFVTRVLDLLPGGRMLSGLAGRARGIVGGMVGGGTPGSGAGAGGSMQQILEARARDFVDGALGRAVHLVVDFLSDPAHAEMMGRWRRDVVRSLAEQPTRALLGVLEGVDTGAVAGDLVRSLRALAAWEGLDGALEGHLEALAAAYDGESVRGLAEGTDIEGALRPLVEALLAEQMATVVRAQRFADWVQAWVQGEAPQEGGPP